MYMLDTEKPIPLWEASGIKFVKDRTIYLRSSLVLSLIIPLVE